MARSLVLVAAVAAVTLACSSGSPPPGPALHYESLVALDDWQGVEHDEDPFVVGARAIPACATPGFRVEADQSWLEIDTTVCAWVTVKGSARFGVEVGEKLKLEVSHFDLDAPTPAEAELRLRFGDCEAWSKTIPIPSAADVLVDELDSPCALREGDAVLFHLQNHGQNTYQLQDVAILR